MFYFCSMNDLKPSTVSLEELLKDSFFYWKSSLFYQFWVTFFYFSLSLFAGLQLSHYYFGDQMQSLSQLLLKDPSLFIQKANQMMNSENGAYFSGFFALMKAALFPINLGLFSVFSCLDEGKKPQFSNLFEGYRGSNFFKFWGYSIFWGVVFQLGVSFLVIPGILWAFATLLVSPILFFTPLRMMDAIPLSAKVVFGNWAVILPCAIVAFLFSYSGVTVFLVGFLFTYPFWNALIYTLFKKYFSVKLV